MRIENGCEVTLVPVIRGFVPDSEKVLRSMESTYDVVGVQLGPEDIEAITKRNEIDGDQEMSDLELVYSHFLMNFGDVQIPTPAYRTLIDICNERSVPVVPLDMDDAAYSDVYCDTISTLELLKETKLAKKFFKKGKFDMSSAGSFVLDWDSQINRIEGFADLARIREEFAANAIRNASKGKESMIAVVELERMKGITDALR